VNHEDSDRVLGVLAEHFPRYGWPAGALRAWYELLDGCGYAPAMAAAWTVVAWHRFPTAAGFSDELERLVVLHRHGDRVDEHDPSPVSSVSRQEALARFAEMRAELVAQVAARSALRSDRSRRFQPPPVATSGAPRRVDETYFAGPEPVPPPEAPPA
jgi:hypothetical protein